MKCSVGHFEYNGECNPCPRGSYQDLPGETSCEKCPEQLTTAGLASVSIDDCSGKYLYKCRSCSLWNILVLFLYNNMAILVPITMPYKNKSNNDYIIVNESNIT